MACLHVQVQPWHPQSTLTHEAGLAVAREAGPAAFWDFSDAMFDQQEVSELLCGINPGSP